MRILPPALLVVVMFAVVPAANAATVRVDNVCETTTKGPEICRGVLTFQAAPGEANNVTADPPAAGTVVLRDTGAPLTAGTGCMQLDAASARCSSITGSVSLGDGNDGLTFPAELTLVTVLGDAGADVIAAAGILRGGDDNDNLSGSKLDGGAGNDVLTGTAAADTFFGGPGDDTIDGGAGRDTVEYGLRPNFVSLVPPPGPELPVTVDLADPAPDGAAGERDMLLAIENVTGSHAAGDVLRGDAGPNVLNGQLGKDRLFGGGGDDDLSGNGELDGGDGADKLVGGVRADTLLGRAGDDELTGAGGADVMDAGEGDDRLDSSEYQAERTFDADRLRCGPGRDRVSRPDIYDRASACERIAIGGGLVVNSSTLVKRSGPRVEVVVLCARRGRRCAIDVASGASSGSALNPPLRVRLAPGARRKLVLARFHPGARARLRRAKVITFGTKDHGFAVRVR